MNEQTLEYYRSNIENFIKRYSETKYSLKKEFPVKNGVLSAHKMSFAAVIDIDEDKELSKNYILIQKGKEHSAITCVHVAINISSKEFAEINELDSDMREWNIHELVRTTENKPVNWQTINPIEQFIALCSYAEGLAEMGAEEIMNMGYLDSTIRATGFNGMLVSQMLKCIWDLDESVYKYLLELKYTKLLELKEPSERTLDIFVEECRMYLADDYFRDVIYKHIPSLVDNLDNYIKYRTPIESFNEHSDFDISVQDTIVGIENIRKELLYVYARRGNRDYYIFPKSNSKVGIIQGLMDGFKYLQLTKMDVLKAIDLDNIYKDIKKKDGKDIALYHVNHIHELAEQQDRKQLKELINFEKLYENEEVIKRYVKSCGMYDYMIIQSD